MWSYATASPFTLITLVLTVRLAITKLPAVNTGTVATLELIFSTNCTVILITPIPTVTVPITNKSDINTIPSATSELKSLVTVVLAAGRLIAIVPAVWAAITDGTLLYAGTVTTPVHGVGVTSTPAWLITSVTTVWITITHTVKINAGSVPTGVVCLRVARTSKLIRLIVTVNPAIAPYTDIQASAIIAAEVKGRVAGAVAVTFI